jgi:hypothetical protein
MPRHTIEEWMSEHVHPKVQPILRYLPRDIEGIRLTQCAVMVALGWMGLLCLAWCGSGCGGQAFSALSTSSDANFRDGTDDGSASSDAGSETRSQSNDASSDAGSETVRTPLTDASSDAYQAETSTVGSDACALAAKYSCGPNGMGSGGEWSASPPTTFCMTSNNLQRFSTPVPTGCDSCETFNCECIAATELCRGMTCSDQGGHVFVTCGM